MLNIISYQVNTNHTPLGMAKMENTKYQVLTGRKAPVFLHIAGGVVNGTTTMENSLTLSHKIMYMSMPRSKNFIPRYSRIMKTHSVKRKESQQLYLHSQALETIQTLINRIIDNQLYYILSKNYASAIKRNKLLITKINIKTSY